MTRVFAKLWHFSPISLLFLSSAPISLSPTVISDGMGHWKSARKKINKNCFHSVVNGKQKRFSCFVVNHAACKELHPVLGTEYMCELSHSV